MDNNNPPEIVNEIMYLLSLDFEEMTVPWIVAWIRYQYPGYFDDPDTDPVRVKCKQEFHQRELETAMKHLADYHKEREQGNS